MLIWDIINGLKLYEVSSYLVDTGFSGNIEVVTMNRKKWKKLSDPDREIFLKAVEEVTTWTYNETLKQYRNIREKLAAAGVHIYTLSPEEKNLYLQDVYSLYPEIRKTSGNIGNQFINILETNDFRDK
jgi:TRAP-type C4-dicarboxylate transport system substrate-binding protein